MQRYIIIRLLQALITLFILSAVIFLLVRISNDPALLMLPDNATENDYLVMRSRLGLDKPIHVQYGLFIKDILQGDLGNSIRTRRPVAQSIVEALPNSLKLIVVSIIIAFLISIPLGVIAAVKKDTFLDTIARVLAGLGQSLPVFWVGLIMIDIFVVRLEVLPASGMTTWKNYLMPALCLAIFLMAGIMRLLRSTMLDVLDSEFIRMARIKGVSEKAVIWKHALRNSLLPVVSFSGMYIAILVTGSILTETIFAWPGFGRLAYTAILNQDFPLIQGTVLTAGFFVMVTNLFTDILYAYLDPRIRYQV